MKESILVATNILWDYMKLYQKPASADCMLVIGSLNDSVAETAAMLVGAYDFKTIVISGGNSRIEKTRQLGWGEDTEAEHYFKVMRSAGCNRSDILLEQRARHTGENAKFTYDLLRNKGTVPESLLIVTKPYMERRSMATFDVQWPDKKTELRVASPDGDLLTYCGGEANLDYTLNVIVGDLQRIIEYPKQGLQSYQDVPNEVYVAFSTLKNAGYVQHLIKPV